MVVSVCGALNCITAVIRYVLGVWESERLVARCPGKAKRSKSHVGKSESGTIAATGTMMFAYLYCAGDKASRGSVSPQYTDFFSP
jgi:hypothetical protein